MSELAFAQPERRSFLLPVIVAVAALGIVGGLFCLYISHQTVKLSVTHVAFLPTHTVFKSDSRLVGHQDPFQDDFYLLVTLRLDNRLNGPIFIKDITATLTASDGTVTSASAVEKNDLDTLYSAFPALVPLASAPLLRETAIQSGNRAGGMVILDFPITQADWDRRKSAAITLDFYHQDPITVLIPKP